MKPYSLNVPTKVYFGRKILREVLETEREVIKGNVLIVSTGRSLVRLGYVDELINEINCLPETHRVECFTDVSANPKLSEVQSGIEHGRKMQAALVVGFGGGSALDAAKAIAAGIGMNERAERLLYGDVCPDNRTLPIIAIPTTAGTGSELSKAAIISDDIRKEKSGIRGNSLFPKLAIVDSAYTESVPLKIKMETGFDVLAHAMESYISVMASPFTMMQSEYAIKLVGQYLPELYKDPNDQSACEKMSFASMLMGINLGNASTCLPHRMQYPVGAVTDTSHASGLAAMYTAWVREEWAYSAEKVKKMIEILTGISCNSGEKASSVMNEFIVKLGLTDSLVKLGVTEEMIPQLVKAVSGNLKNDPVSQSENIVEKIYRLSL